MIILNESTKEIISNVSIFLARSEAIQMAGYLEDLLRTAERHHCHINNDDYSREITISLYDKSGNLDGFAENYRKIILSDG